MPQRQIARVIAENVKALRKAQKKTQPKVSEAARLKGFVLDQGTISRIENQSLDPSLSVLQALAAGLEVQLWQLLVPSLDPLNLPALKAATEAEKLLWERLKAAAKQAGIS